MTVITLLLLIVIAVGCALRNWRRTGWSVAVLALVLLFATGCGPVPDWS
jgi:hypothetical protein